MSSNNIVWIDTTSGTWGTTEMSNGSLVLVDLDAQAAEDTAAGVDTDADSLYAFLDGCSDSEIIDYGLANGKPAVLPPDTSTMDALRAAVSDLLPSVQWELDNDGQWIIYTGLTGR